MSIRDADGLVRNKKGFLRNHLTIPPQYFLSPKVLSLFAFFVCSVYSVVKIKGVFMLDTDTKRRIDTARDILVGKVPDPKSQVEQITIALIYKFMDDMDAESEEFGGKRKFFAGAFARYGWAKLMRSGLGGHETLNLYAEAIAKMPENPGIPLLFRDIFKNAYLPYRDPETLRAFLKIIDEFTYDHSERLGDAFEYLLSVLGSQGDAGQFRTPRHIIDFIVGIVDPKKTETVLDPACGTAGFLISAYKHILAANRVNMDKQDGQDKHKKSRESCPSTFNSLTPDEKGRLAQNFKGYDISPDMVRLSLVNLYLHGFADPHVIEYDTLTSQERWNEDADVILANPPFMSPKGGIKPHNRFSVQSKRSEVLFVDYMAEHLKSNGRAGIIVPEGIIFQSQNAYKQLRKMLVEQYLVAVVSLPAGVFNPYSGVKTSILFLDKSLSKKTGTIAFFKIENDGFGLGAQRREIEKNDLPETARMLKEWVNHGIHGTHGKITAKSTSMPPTSSTCSVSPVSSSTPPASSVCSVSSVVKNCLIVPKEKIAANGEYNLSGERYREGSAHTSEYPHIRLGEVCDINPETLNPAELYPDSFFNYIDISCVENGSGKFLGANKIPTDEAPSRARRSVTKDDVLISTVRPNLKAFTILKDVPERAIASTGFAVLRAKTERMLPGFLISMLRHEKAVDQMIGMMGKGAYPSINQSDVESVQIPLPPLAVQKEIVAEIEGYQKVINGARAVLDNYRPHIPIHPDWPMVTIGEVVESILLGLIKNKAEQDAKHTAPYIKMHNITSDGYLDLTDLAHVDATDDEVIRYALFDGDFIYNTRNAPNLVGKSAVFHGENGRYLFNNNILRIRFGPRANPDFVNTVMNSESGKSKIRSQVDSTTSVAALYQKNYLAIEIPLPPLATQQAIVAEIEAEQSLVAANRELIFRFEKKIQATLARVWGEEEPVREEA